MKVKEMIEELSQLDPEAHVGICVVNGDDVHLVSAAMPEPVKIVQIFYGPRDVLFGLGSDGAVYYEAFDDNGQNPHWRLYRCPLSQQPQPTTP